MTSFGDKLRELRDAAGLTQQGLADAAGIPIGTIRDYEQNLRDPLLSNAQKLAATLGISLDVFPPPGTPRAQARGRPRKASAQANGPSATRAPKKPARTAKRKDK